MRRLAFGFALLAAGCSGDPTKSRLSPGDEMIVVSEKSKDVDVLRYTNPLGTRRDTDWITPGTKVRVVSDDDVSPPTDHPRREVVVLPLEGRLQGGSVFIHRDNLLRPR